MEKRFLVQFTKKSLKEYEALDGSIIEEVNTALESLEQRADQVGKLLGNKRQIHLKGTKEKKLRSSGVRIIYQITDQYVDILAIVNILLIDFKKNETEVYTEAEIRFREAKNSIELPQKNSPFIWKIDKIANQDLDQGSMIDQIFDDHFDDLEESIKEQILHYFSYGEVEKAYQIRCNAVQDWEKD